MMETASSAITQFTSQQVLAPTNSLNLIELQAWVRDYEVYNKYCVSSSVRFSIGIYQIYQGMAWKQVDNMAESYCSAFLHFLMVSERLKLNIEKHFEDIDLNVLPRVTIHEAAHDLLFNISKAQQHIFYNATARQTVRAKSRYNSEILEGCLSIILKNLIGLVPINARKVGIDAATTIMCGKL